MRRHPHETGKSGGKTPQLGRKKFFCVPAADGAPGGRALPLRQTRRCRVSSDSALDDAEAFVEGLDDEVAVVLVDAERGFDADRVRGHAATTRRSLQECRSYLFNRPTNV